MRYIFLIVLLYSVQSGYLRDQVTAGGVKESLHTGVHLDKPDAVLPGEKEQSPEGCHA